MATPYNITDRFLDRVLREDNTAIRIFYDGLPSTLDAVDLDLTQFDDCAIAGIHGSQGLLIFRDQIDQYLSEEDVVTPDFD
jgi:hypothetical protein